MRPIGCLRQFPFSKIGFSKMQRCIAQNINDAGQPLRSPCLKCASWSKPALLGGRSHEGVRYYVSRCCRTMAANAPEVHGMQACTDSVVGSRVGHAGNNLARRIAMRCSKMAYNARRLGVARNPTSSSTWTDFSAIVQAQSSGCVLVRCKDVTRRPHIGAVDLCRLSFHSLHDARGHRRLASVWRASHVNTAGWTTGFRLAVGCGATNA